MTLDCKRSCDAILADLRYRIAHRESQFQDHLLVLYAGCNIPPGDRGFPHAQSLDAMPAQGSSDAKEQPGSALVADLEVAMSEVAASLFGAAWADARLPSCTIANLAVYHALGERGVILGPASEDGGHFSQVGGGTPSVAGLTVNNLPFDAVSQTLDAEETARLVQESRPELVMLGRSVVLHPDALDGVVQSARKVGTRTIYDASHVAGLIAGGVFPNPLEAGIDLITMSTYKTLGGPPGAIIAGRDPEDAVKVQRAINGAFLANQGAARYPNLLAALLTLRDGSSEPKRVVENADAFKTALAQNGVEVLAPDRVAATHQVVVPVGELRDSIGTMHLLESAGILVGRCPIPGRPDCYGLRFGTQYATRRGLGASDMRKAATLVARLLNCPQKDPSMLADVSERISTLLESIPTGRTTTAS